eukprot:m51a1_g12016 hydrogenase maturase protein G (537) ;mRNA; f:3549-5710
MSSIVQRVSAAPFGLALPRRSASTPSGYRWSVEKEPHVLTPASEIIRVGEIEKMIEETRDKAKDIGRVRDILAKARERAKLRHVRLDECRSEYVQGLNLEETATLLNMDTKDKTLMNELFSTALDIKQQIYGKRIVLFAPLYLSNYCMNQCTYCAFRGPNHDLGRKKLSIEEVKAEGRAIQHMGHKRTLVLCGESPVYTFDEFLEALKALRDLKTPPHGEFRRINVEIPALSVSDMRRLKELRCVGTYTIFQETYHPEAYKRFHPAGPKADYEHRVQTMDRAQLGGVDDVGIGALLGLHDFRFEVLAMLQHAQHLDATYGAGPHTISIPRIRPAAGAETSLEIPHPVDDDSFRKLVSVIRCAVPYTGMILSTREPPAIRRELIALGVSQLSAGSRTDVGAYKEEDAEDADAHADQHGAHYEGQFTLSDERPVPEIVHDLLKRGCVPSWCTACYRMGRTGEAFMRICKRGEIADYCGPNALFTLKEYLVDYAPKEVRAEGERVIAREVEKIADPQRREATKQRLEAIEKQGLRDVYF